MPACKTLAILLALVLCFSLALPVCAAYSPPFEVQSDAVILVNLNNDAVVFEKNADKQVYPASLTKIMTVALALENIPDPDNTKIALKLYLQDMLYGRNPSLGGIYQGEEVSVTGLLYACMLQSANEAALMLADYMGDGSLTRFYEMMNQKAQQLGCTGTNFSSCNGLFEEDNYTTARDMYIITKYAMNLPGFMEICSAVTKDIGPTNKHDSLVEISTIDMLKPSSSYYYAPLRGIKTGTLPESGRCLASTATQDGQTYLMVLLGAPIEDSEGNTYPQMIHFVETKKLYQWAFESFTEKALLEEGSHVADVSVRLSSEKDVARLLTASPFAALVPMDVETASLQLIPELPETIDAPVQKGDRVGSLRILLAGEEIGRLDLVSGDTISRNPLLYFFDTLGGIFSSFLFKFLFVFLIVLLCMYIVLTIVRNRRRRQHYKRTKLL